MDGAFSMVTWKLYDDTGEKWNELLSGFERRSYSQLFDWGEYKRKLGWYVIRTIAEDGEGNCIGLAQGTYKTYPFHVAVLWVPGGPVGKLKNIDDGLFECLKDSIKCKRLYCRISPSHYENELHLTNKWRQSSQKINSSLSMLLKLDDDDFNLNNLDKNWKKNLKKSGKYELTIERVNNPDYKVVESLYKNMEEHKNINVQYSTLELENIFNLLSDCMGLYVCRNKDGEVIAMRSCVFHKEKAWELMAASNSDGRKKSAAYLLLWRMLEDCKIQNVLYFDLGGIDPVNNSGVWYFKKGTGATEIKYAGEYEKSSIPLLAWLINLYIKHSR
mgnify:CR=1 FL=1